MKTKIGSRWGLLLATLLLVAACGAPAQPPATSAPASTSTGAKGPQPGKTYKIGYSQIVDHPSLNETRRGFLDGLKQAGFVEGTNLQVDYQNAQNDVANARNIADKFMSCAAKPLGEQGARVLLAKVRSLETLPYAKAAATRALELAPELAEGHSTLAMVSLFLDHDVETALTHWRRAIEIEPGNVRARCEYGFWGLSAVAGDNRA